MTRNKRCALSLRCDGDGEKMSLVVRRRERVCTVFMKRLICIIPPQTVEEGGARYASRPSYSASARSFRLIRRMSVGVGGLAWARFRADLRRFDATELDPRLPCWVRGGRCRTDWRRRAAGGVTGGLGVGAEDGLGDGLGDGLRRRGLPGSSSASLRRDAVDGGRES